MRALVEGILGHIVARAHIDGPLAFKSQRRRRPKRGNIPHLPQQ